MRWNPRTHVYLVLLLFWAAVEVRTDDSKIEKDICAMTKVLSAMKELLVMLSGEIRDLRKQVGQSCQPAATTSCQVPHDPDDPTQNTTTTEDTITDTLETTMAAVTDPIPTVEDYGKEEEEELELELEVEEDDYDDYLLEGNLTNPIENVVTGLQDWWGNFNFFQPQPTTADDTKPETDEASNDDDEEEPDQAQPEPDVAQPEPEPEPEPEPPKPITTTTTTTTTTTPLPYTLPPAPTSCDDPFRLFAESCYLILNSQRDWKTWGEADNVCQNYGGRLAAPWRLQPLQNFLSRHYSDAFWVGGLFQSSTRSWKWLSGRPVQDSEWNPGQPNRNPGKRCLFLNKWSGYQGSNYFCGEKYPFICEKQDV